MFAGAQSARDVRRKMMRMNQYQIAAIAIPGRLKNAIHHASRPYGRRAWAGKAGGVTGGWSVGAIGAAMAQQHLRNILACLAVPTLGQPEAFIHAKDGLFDDAGNVSDSSVNFLQAWMDCFVVWVKLHAH